MATMENSKGTRALWWLVALLLIGAPVLALVFRSWEVGGLVFGLGAILLGIGNIRSSQDRADRFVGIALVLGGAFTAIDGAVLLLSGAGL